MPTSPAVKPAVAPANAPPEVKALYDDLNALESLALAMDDDEDGAPLLEELARLKDVMQLLRGITQGQFGIAPVQVILTTHSPYLLDDVKPEEDQVLVFQRDEDGSRTAKPVDWSRLKEYFDGFLLGEIWFNEEEVGLIAQGAS